MAEEISELEVGAADHQRNTIQQNGSFVDAPPTPSTFACQQRTLA